MIAFAAVLPAVGCALAVQEELVDATWPPELLSLPRCATDADGVVLWSGIRAVNIAARVESAALELSAPAVVDFGVCPMKGI
eukprot:gene52326-17014_t